MEPADFMVSTKAETTPKEQKVPQVLWYEHFSTVAQETWSLMDGFLICQNKKSFIHQHLFSEVLP